MSSNAHFKPQMNMSYRLQSNMLHEETCMHDFPYYLDVICSAVGGESSSVWANETGRYAGQTTPENHQVPSFAESCSEDHRRPPHQKRTWKNGETVTQSW